VPTDIGGVAHTCGRSGFIKGKTYPTVHLERMQMQLYALSAELVTDMKSEYSKLGEILVPVSMALLTDYNADYLGLTQEKEDSQDGR
jgi:uncharacterized membrane-anchored protein YhcB (DUF1043 family)